MRTFAQKQNQPQKPLSSIPARSHTAILGPNHHTHPILHLQRTIGNQAVQRMLQTNAEELKAGLTGTASPLFGHDFSRIPVHPPAARTIQAKLTVNTPSDIYEQEADAVTEQVMHMATPLAPNVQRQTQAEKLIQRKTTGDAQVQTAPPIAHEVLRSSGQPLDVATRAFMERRFGHDFSRVRVHLDSQAAASARDVNALAYTVGRDIVFAHGQFAPHTASGQRLLAHELAHTLQQGVAAEQVTMGDFRVGQQNDPFEHEAERVSTSVLSAPVGASSEKPPTTSVRSDARSALRRQPRPRGIPEDIPPLEHLPPKEERSVTTPTSTPTSAQPACKSPSDIALPCSPKGVSNDDFLKTGAPKEAFGHTIIPVGAKFSVPEVLTKPVAKDKRVVIQNTKVTPAPCQSFFTKAGHFSRMVSIHANDPEQLADKCGSSYLGKFNIVPAGEKRIIKAEMEHCTDYKYAFDISLGCYAAVVNDLAKTKKVFPSHEDAVDAVTKSTGQKPDTWTDHYLKLIAKSADRDTNKWHTAIWQGPALFVETDRSGQCKSKTEAEINGKSYPEVDKHQTPDVIKL
jgi:hypothetical protein